MSEPVADYDCRICGACCTAPSAMPGYVRLYDIDLERLRGTELPILHSVDEWSDWSEEIDRLGTKIDDTGRRMCIAFEGEVGKACGCGIYEQRPSICRKVEPHSFVCCEARRAAGLPL